MFAAERQFVTTAQNHLGQLMDAGGDVPLVLQSAALHKIKQAAAHRKARAIYRAAILCEDVLNGGKPDTSARFQVELARLKSLLGLYENGLREIDPEFENLQPAQGLTSPSFPPKAANENAAQLLTPLLDLLGDDDPRHAMEFLIQYGRSHAPQADTPQTHTTQAHTTRTQASAKVPNLPANPPARFFHNKGAMHFETMMGQITNRVLSEARLNAKGVSLSYASDFDSIGFGIVKPLQAVLENMCLEIVRYGLVDETLTHKYARRVWQISITATLTEKGQGQKYLISLSWPGHALPKHQKPAHILSEFQDIGGHIHHKTSKYADRDVVRGVDTGLDVQVLEILCPVKQPDKHQTKTARNGANNHKTQVNLYTSAANM